MEKIEPRRPGKVKLSVSGKKGEKKWAQVYPESGFAVERVVASDTHGGQGSKILLTIVDKKIQNQNTIRINRDGDIENGLLSFFFSPMARGNSVKFDTCRAGQSIKFFIEFLEDGTWEATLEGQAFNDPASPGE